MCVFGPPDQDKQDKGGLLTNNSFDVSEIAVISQWVKLPLTH